MELRSLFGLPRSFRGCLRTQPSVAIGVRRFVSSSASSSTPESRAPQGFETSQDPDATATTTTPVPSLATDVLPTPPSSTATERLKGGPASAILKGWDLNTGTQPTPSTKTPIANRGNGLLGLSNSFRASPSVRDLDDFTQMETPRQTEHHLHIFATKHNCHMTLTAPTEATAKGLKRKSLISLSCGNIGFRKAARGSYDAAFQLGSYMMSRIQNQGLLAEIQRLELVIRGFGPGREAVQKILLGVEGAALRPRIIRVVDATRLKFGGTRSKKPRRLG
jgi:ribosomal protein S11